MVRRLLLFFSFLFCSSPWTLDDDDVAATWPPFTSVRRRIHSHRQPSRALAISGSKEPAHRPFGFGMTTTASQTGGTIMFIMAACQMVHSWPVVPAAVVCISERIVLESPAPMCVCVCVCVCVQSGRA